MAATEVGQSQTAQRRFAKNALSKPLLTLEREQELARAWADNQDTRALHELTQAHMRLVIAMAYRFRHYGLPVGDLIQEGNVGLMHAAQRFDADRGVRFSTYAGWWIRSQIQDYILRNWSIVRTGTTSAHKSLFFNLRRLRAKIANGTKDALTHTDHQLIGQMLHVSPEDVAYMEGRLSGSDRSLNAPAGGAGEEDAPQWQDLLVGDDESPDDQAISARDTELLRQHIARALQELSEREQKIVETRQLREEPLTLEMLGKQLGISKERVRQIEQQALKKMKEALVASLGQNAEAALHGY
ncbi:RNA polymerase factor sigma-32 [Tepidicaulis sp.]|jgi:RNA polymerase sigma-32 factor|uniref:RNA polymerase factor sigma-32 n=1 Tax=Tepidicaulis sp. TaxID=1920809 RepID=UPI003B5A247B